MAFSLGDLLKNQHVKAGPAKVEPPRPSVNPILSQGTDFASLMRVARQKDDSLIAAEKAEVQRAAAEQRRVEQYEQQEAARMDDDGLMIHPKYLESKELVVIGGLPAIHEESEEWENWEPEWDDTDQFYEDDSDSYFDDIMAGVHIKALDPSQEAAVRELATRQYGCLIGAAGTGKTTTARWLLNTLINGDAEYDIEPLRLTRVNLRAYQSSTAEAGEDGEAAKDLIPSIAFCAYTGQATQVLKSRMPGSWQKNVFTIHAMLGFYPEVYTKPDGKDSMRFVPYYTSENKMPWDVIFIDEASMVAVELWHMMLDAMKPGCRVYMIGDLNQLPPPVGQGILGFALAKWHVSELTHVHRTEGSTNRIVEVAHQILKGKPIVFDDPVTNPHWSVIGMQLEHDTAKAHLQIINICRQLKDKKHHDGDAVYDPWRDRVMTQMNGFDENNSASLVGQHPINDALSQIFADKEQPRIIIDAQREQKRFSVGYRVMATKNESPAEVNRVTNGLTGVIIGIEENSKWAGDRRLVGPEDVVRVNRSKMLDEAMNHKLVSTLDRANELSLHLDSFEFKPDDSETDERGGGPASHIVTVKFDNGATRRYTMNTQVEQLRIAYASTTHKAQGAEMPTAIIIVHHASKQMLCRENLYTAVTRATKRVIILYSEHGLRIALATQKITGVTLEQKLKQYERMLGEEGGMKNGFKLYNVRLGEEV